jgi:MFS superfamily sulfate permease-like transporter
LRLSEKQINAVLFVTQGVAAVFVGVFLAAYLAGLPTTVVFHSEPAFRIPLAILGAVLLIMVLAISVLAVLSKKD